MDDFRKQRSGAPEGFFATEAAGLRWLAQAESAGGAQVVEVHQVNADGLVLQRVPSSTPTAEAARAFGMALAATHAAGASAFGALPPSSGHYFFGPLDSPIEFPTGEFNDFGTFFATARLRPLAEMMSLDVEDAALLDDICAALCDGAAEFGGKPVHPARVHGDLWSGNLMWSPGGVVLIDPAACGNHPFADLGMLAMFGAPHLEEIFAGYEKARPLREGWREELPLHQLFGYLVHVYLFGTSYLRATREALQRTAVLLNISEV